MSIICYPYAFHRILILTISCLQMYVAVHNKTIDYLGMRWTCAVSDQAKSFDSEAEDFDSEAEDFARVSRASFFTINKELIYDIFSRTVYFSEDRSLYESLYNCARPLGRIRSFVYINVDNHVFVFCKCAIYNSASNTNYSSVELFDLGQIDVKIIPIPLMFIRDPVVVAPWLKESKLHAVLKIVI